MTSAERGSMSFVYRFFDADGALLYVGCTYNMIARKSQHRKKTPWFGDVARIEIEEFSSRLEADLAELEYIRAERPRYNVTGVAAPIPLDGRIVSYIIYHELIEVRRARIPTGFKLMPIFSDLFPTARNEKMATPQELRQWRAEIFDEMNAPDREG